MLDYYSDVPTYALAFSPLSTSTSLSLAVGSFVDTPVRPQSSSSNQSPTPSQPNHLTVISSSPAFAELEDDYDDPPGTPGSSSNGLDGFARNRHRARVSTSGGGFVAVARAPHPYPPSALAFSPARMTATMQGSASGTVGEHSREMVASSAECLRLWDLVGDEAAGSGGFVGAGRGMSGTRLVQRAMLANVSCFHVPRLNARATCARAAARRVGAPSNLETDHRFFDPRSQKQTTRHLSPPSPGQRWNQHTLSRLQSTL